MCILDKGRRSDQEARTCELIGDIELLCLMITQRVYLPR